MKFKLILLCSLLILLIACSRNTKLPDDVNPVTLTIVDSLESDEIGYITSMNIIDDKLFVVEKGQHKYMLINTESMEIVDSLGSPGQGPLEFSNPKNIVGLNGNYLVHDSGNSRFQVLDSDLKLKKTIKSPLIWTIKNYENMIYGSTPGMLPGANIFKIHEDGNTTEILSLDPFFDKLKLTKYDRLFNFCVYNDKILITLSFCDKLYMLDFDGKYEELKNPLSKMKYYNLHDFQQFRNGFLVFSKYPVKENIFIDDFYFQSHLLYYENNKIKQIYEIPRQVDLGFIGVWVTDGEYIYAFDRNSSVLYKLKIND